MKKAGLMYISGIIAPLSYTLAVIIGGFLLNDYSHTYNSISELTASNVHKIPIIYILFFMYNFSLIIFGIGIYANLKIIAAIKVKVASLMLICIGILGVAMLYFVQDPRNIAMTFNGKVHIVLAGITSVLTMAAIVLMAVSFKNDPKLKNYTVYSFVSLAIVLITGGIAGISVANNSAVGGLFERLTIGAFMQWLLVIAITLINKEKNSTV